MSTSIIDVSNGVCLFGAGTNGQWCLDFCIRHDIKVLKFIDNNANLIGKQVDGIDVISYSEYERYYSIIPVLVTSKHYAKDILEQHKDSSCMIAFDAWFEKKYANEFNNLQFEDDYSIHVLDSIRKAMRLSDESVLWDIMEDNQYFCMPPFKGNCNEVFVDLGACTGDTIERFLISQNGAFRKIYAFEPGDRQVDAMQYRLSRLMKEWAIPDTKISVIKGASGKEDGILYFQESSLAMSDMVNKNAKSGKRVDVYSLDNYFENEAI